VLHATHDIACDGFYIQALDRKDQALYAGVRVAAFRIAMILGSSLLVKYVATVSWFLAFGAAAAAMLATALINVFVMPRPPTPTEVPKVASKGPAFWTAYRTFLQQPQAVLVLSFMFLYRLGDIMMFAMSKPLLRDLGVDTAHRGLLNGLGTFVFILGSLAGGGLIARRTLERTLVPILYLQNLAIPLYIAMAVLRPTFGGVMAIVLVEQLVSGVGASAHVVFLIRRSRGLFSASHYAFATAVVSLGSTLSGYASGPLNQHFGHPIFFTLAFIAGWPALVASAAADGAPLGFVDPMCGSGTLCIEAALIAGDVAPGLLRERFGFAGWRGHEAAVWEALLDEARQRRAAARTEHVVIRGYDRDPGAVRAARENAGVVGLDARIAFERREIDALDVLGLNSLVYLCSTRLLASSASVSINAGPSLRSLLRYSAGFFGFTPSGLPPLSR